MSVSWAGMRQHHAGPPRVALLEQLERILALRQAAVLTVERLLDGPPNPAAAV